MIDVLVRLLVERTEVNVFKILLVWSPVVNLATLRDLAPFVGQNLPWRSIYGLDIFAGWINRQRPLEKPLVVVMAYSDGVVAIYVLGL